MAESSKTCPYCGLINPDSATTCDCGFDFNAGPIEFPENYIECQSCGSGNPKDYKFCGACGKALQKTEKDGGKLSGQKSDLGSASKDTARKELFPSGAWSFNGFGSTLYGKRDFRTDGSFVTTKWLIAFFVPIIPLKSMRIKLVSSGSPEPASVPLLPRWTQRYIVLEKCPLNLIQVLSTYAFVSGFFLLLWAFELPWFPLPEWGGLLAILFWLTVPWILRTNARSTGLLGNLHWSQRKFAIPLILVMAILLGIFVWPTRYRYDHLRLGENDLPMRIDRLTGRTEVIYGVGGWVQWGGGDSQAAKELPSSELPKLTGEASITSYGYIECQIHNGSNWTVDELTIEIDVYPDPDTTKWQKFQESSEWRKLSREEQEKGRQMVQTPFSKQYTLFKKSGTGAPMEVTDWSADLGFKLVDFQAWSFRITSAKGRAK